MTRKIKKQQIIYNYYSSLLVRLIQSCQLLLIVKKMQLKELITEAIKITGLKTEEEVLELGLKTVINLKKQEKIKDFKGKLLWEGNLEEMRLDK